jgi:hypothetical protein
MRALVLTGVLVAWPSFAFAAPQEAAERFREAQGAFARGEYVAAAAAFEEVARAEPHAAAWLNAADARERAGDYPHAAEDCDLASQVPSASEAHRAEAERRLARLLPRVATLELRGPRALLLRIDGMTEVHPPATRRLRPGAHVVAIDDLATGQRRSEELRIEAGQSATLDVTPPPSAAPPAARPAPAVAPGPEPAPERARPSTSAPLAPWVALGVAGACVATAGVFGALTVGARDDYNARPSDETSDVFYRDRTITNVALGGALLAGVVAVLAWRLGR